MVGPTGPLSLLGWLCSDDSFHHPMKLFWLVLRAEDAPPPAIEFDPEFGLRIISTWSRSPGNGALGEALHHLGNGLNRHRDNCTWHGRGDAPTMGEHQGAQEAYAQPSVGGKRASIMRTGQRFRVSDKHKKPNNLATALALDPHSPGCAKIG